MNQIKYVLTALRLRWAMCRTKNAKNQLVSAIHNSHRTTKKLDSEYARFLMLSEKQQQIAVQEKRYRFRKSDSPILKHKIKVKKITFSEAADRELTTLDIRMGLARHQHCDWGHLIPADWRNNNQAVMDRTGIVCSRFPYRGDRHFLIETDLDKQMTEIRLEGETV